MRLHRLEVRNFRGIDARTLELPDAGVVVVEGPNESGKSSLFEALHFVLERKATSRAGEVWRVRPLGRDVGPSVTAELSLGSYRFRLTKRWLREPQTTLDLFAPSPPRQLVGEEAEQWLAAAFAAHLDRPLWEALQVAQGASLARADPGGSDSLLRALDRATGAAAGSDDGDRDLRKAVERERNAVLTPGTGRPKGALRDAEERRDRAVAVRERLEEDLRGVEAQLEEAARLEAEVVRLRAWVASQRRELERLAPALERLRALEAGLERRRAELRLATAEEQAATLELESRRRRVDEASADDRRAHDLLHELGRTDRHREDLAAQLGEATAREREALAALGAAEHRLAAGHEREALERDRAELEELRRLEDRLERLLATRADAAALLAGDRIGRDDLATLIELERAAAIAGARAERSATAVRLRPEAELLVLSRGGSVPPVEGDPLGESADDPRSEGRVEAAGQASAGDGQGEALAPGVVREWQVEGRLALRLPGVAELEVVVGAEASAQALSADRAASALASACAALGVETVDEARHRVAAQAQASADLEKWDLAVATLLDGRTPAELAERRLVLERRARGSTDLAPSTDPAPVEGRDPVTFPDLAVEVAALAEAVERAREEVSVTATRSRDLGAAHAGLAATHRERAKALEDANGRRQASAAALARARESVGDEELAARVAAERARRDQLALAVAAAEAELGAADSTGLRLQEENLRRALAGAAEQEAVLDGQLRELRLRLELQGEAGLAEDLERARSEAAWATEQAEARRLDADALDLLLVTLERHRRATKERLRVPFLHKLEELGRVVFGPTFAVSLDDELRVSARTLDGVTVQWEDLSGGAKEQLNLLLRLAAALLVDPGDGVPLLVDDALGYADDERLRRVGAVVGIAGRYCQVIVLTCVPERYRGVGGAQWIRLDRLLSAQGGGGSEAGPAPSVPRDGDGGETGPGSGLGWPALGSQPVPPPKVVRAWALAHGFDVGTRGRLPPAVLAAWTEAQRSRSAPPRSD